ncbi:MAG: iron-containing alcohol dehydrogenase [Clostridiales bacterium]|nr:iron-containing alcohol dehydrogenase [Clostridiales bacterium]
MNIFRKMWCRLYQSVFKVVLPMMPYREPKILDSVVDIKDVFDEYKYKNVMLVTDSGVRGLGLTKELEDNLVKNGYNLTVFDHVIPNPTIANIEEGLSIYKANKCEAIIAFGGGSVMDCAKIIGARVVKPNQSVQKMKGLLKIRKKLPLLIAVPTTAGTGSEVTLAAVITDEKTHHKYPINDFNLIPKYAVLDYKTTLGLPPHLTSTTGLDALTHAVEAYIGRSTTKYTRAKAEESIKLIHDNLLKVYQDGSDKDARANMLHASFCAGIAFTRSYVGYVHAVAHSLGGKYGVPHGLANAILLPYFLEDYGKSIEKKLSKLAKLIDLVKDDVSIDAGAKAFIDWVKLLNEKMNIPRYVEGLKEADIPELALKADAEGNPLYPVPVLKNAKELEKMYRLVLKK